MPSYVLYDPLIHTGDNMQGVRDQTGGKLQGSYHAPNNPPLVPEDSENNGYLLIQDLWKRGTDSIHGIVRCMDPLKGVVIFPWYKL